MIQRIAGASLAFMSAAALLASPASATLEYSDKKSGSVIRVCGKTGHWECVSARTRVTALDKQYLSPGGSWRSCRGDCRDQLRRDTVDFWDYQRD